MFPAANRLAYRPFPMFFRCMSWVPVLCPGNGESSGNAGGGFYLFLGFIINVRADGKINSVIRAYIHGPTWNKAMASIVLVTMYCCPDLELLSCEL
jgi:hypothetical protein